MSRYFLCRNDSDIVTSKIEVEVSSADAIIQLPSGFVEVTRQEFEQAEVNDHYVNGQYVRTPPAVTSLSKVQFALLFTKEQFLALDQLEQSGDPDVRYFMGLTRFAEYIDLADPVVQFGLPQLGAKHPTILPPGEVSRILAGQRPPAPTPGPPPEG